MNCYDCHSEDLTVTPAVALCCRCGAALCTDHVQTRPELIHRVRGMGLATLPDRARRITCTVCCKAETG
ncbi:DUF2180 family protein [Streptomyces hokutonensis]|uniref:DUF2180 family protein n=1 Tax=Streptomyces hokutonensis TaxID=1306990 RepID=UPI000997335F|nr:DUF2180 family protein [Streptomyces hokutonensis]